MVKAHLREEFREDKPPASLFTFDAAIW